MKGKNSWFAEQFIRWVGAGQLLEEGHRSRSGNPSERQAKNPVDSTGQVSNAARESAWTADPRKHYGELPVLAGGRGIRLSVAPDRWRSVRVWPEGDARRGAESGPQPCRSL